VRISDICTRLDDTLTVAAFYVCLLRMLWRLRRDNVQWRRYRNLLIEENRWRAQRYGFDSGLIDFGRGEIVPYGELLDELIELLLEDAEALGCVDSIANARDIVRRGTSAHRQVAVYNEAVAGGAEPREALKQVVDWLIGETLFGLEPAP
jgi:glutamate---cysteine ligase / carboxylate-amine ligase